MEGLTDEDVKCGGVDRRVQKKLHNESGERGERHVQAVHQVGDDEVPELQQLLGHGGSQEARQERQTPEQWAWLEGVEKIPPSEHVRRDEEEAHQLVPLEEPFPHVEGEMAVIGEEVLVDEGELPHQEQGGASEEEEEQRLFLQSLEEAKNAVVAQRDGEGEEEGEGEEIEELGEVEAGLVARPVAHHYPIIQHYEHQETHTDCCVRPGHQQHRLHVTGWREELQREEQHLLSAADRQRDLGRRGLLVPLLRMLHLPGLVHFGSHQRARAEGHPDDVGLAEEHWADAEERRGLVAAVERHEVGEEDEESRSGIGVVEEVEEVEHGEGGQRERWEDSAWGCSCLEERKRDVRGQETDKPNHAWSSPASGNTFSLRCSLQMSR